MASLDADQIIELVLNRCGNRSNDAALTSAAELELTRVIYELEQHPDPMWFLYSTWASATLTANEPRMPLPSDYLMPLEDSHLYVVDLSSNRTKLKKDDFDALEAYYLSSSAALPKQYALFGDYFYLFPTPDAAYTLQMKYAKTATALTPSVRTNEWTQNAADLLMARLGIVMVSSYLRESDASLKAFQDEALRAWNRLYAKHVARAVVNDEMVMGD